LDEVLLIDRVVVRNHASGGLARLSLRPGCRVIELCELFCPTQVGIGHNNILVPAAGGDRQIPQLRP
jgi:hypothetical protein